MAKPNDNQEIPAEFFEVADQFIGLANALSQKWSVQRISSAMMFATSRYNAFNASHQDPDIAVNRDKLIEFFCSEYRGMFTENLDDHISNKP